jgi:hypothetical protein
MSPKIPSSLIMIRFKVLLMGNSVNATATWIALNRNN